MADRSITIEDLNKLRLWVESNPEVPDGEWSKEREPSKSLVGRIAIMEANADRLGIDPEEMHQPIVKPVRTMSRAGQGGTRGSASGRVQSRNGDEDALHRQTRAVFGVYLHYTRVNGRAPAEADMERYFGVTPPSVHQMILTLEARRLSERTPRLGAVNPVAHPTRGVAGSGIRLTETRRVVVL